MKPRHEITDLMVCRAFFAAWVFIYHIDLHAGFSAYLGPFAGLIRRGYLGVDGFFILSGLILSRAHPELALDPAGGALRFYAKRLARIYPVHLATIAIIGILVLVAHGSGAAIHEPQRFGTWPLIQNLALIQSWGFSSQWSWNYPSWTLSCEWAGYLLFPLFWFAANYWLYEVNLGFCIIAVPILGLLSHVTGGHGLNLPIYLNLWRFFPEFIAGIALARLVPYAADNMPSKIIAHMGWVLALLGAAVRLDVLSFFGLWLLIAGLAMQFDAERPAVFGKPGIGVRLGHISYSFYMSFAIAELILAQLFRGHGWDPAAMKLGYSMAMTGLTFAIAFALFFVVEEPFRRLGNRLIASRARQ